MEDEDDFSIVLDEAIKSTEDELPNILEEEQGGGDLDEIKPSPAHQSADGDHGGDIDDPSEHIGNRLNLDQLRAEKIQQAEQLLRDWTSEKSQREQAFRDAQAAYRAARKAIIEDPDGDQEPEFRAQEALMEARIALDKANDGYNRAATWQQQVQSEPQLSAAQKAWVESNPKYMSDTAFQQRANRIMAKLRDEGYDDTRAPFFERVNKVLREKPRMGQDRRPASGAPAIRTSKTESRKESNKISPGEERAMQRIGINPRDERVRAQWIESRNRTRAIAQRKGFM